MKTTLHAQFTQEHNEWKRKLEFFTQENAILKYRLSEIVDNNEDKEFLQMAEHFQNEFLFKDDLLVKLKRELQELFDQLNGLENERSIAEKIGCSQDMLRDDLIKFKKSFLHLSEEFNRRMLQSQ